MQVSFEFLWLRLVLSPITEIGDEAEFGGLDLAFWRFDLGLGFLTFILFYKKMIFSGFSPLWGFSLAWSLIFCVLCLL